MSYQITTRIIENVEAATYTALYAQSPRFDHLIAWLKDKPGTRWLRETLRALVVDALARDAFGARYVPQVPQKGDAKLLPMDALSALIPPGAYRAIKAASEFQAPETFRWGMAGVYVEPRNQSRYAEMYWIDPALPYFAVATDGHRVAVAAFDADPAAMAFALAELDDKHLLRVEGPRVFASEGTFPKYESILTKPSKRDPLVPFAMDFDLEDAVRRFIEAWQPGATDAEVEAARLAYDATKGKSKTVRRNAEHRWNELRMLAAPPLRDLLVLRVEPSGDAWLISGRSDKFEAKVGRMTPLCPNPIGVGVKYLIEGLKFAEPVKVLPSWSHTGAPVVFVGESRVYAVMPRKLEDS